MKKIFLFSCVLIFCIPNAIGQVMFESSSGDGSIVLHDAGTLSFNFAATSIKLGYHKVLSTSPLRFGFEIKTASTEGFTSIFKGNEISLPETTGTIFIGHKIELFSSKWGLIGANLEYKRGLYQLATVDTSGEISTTSKKFNGISSKALFNLFFDGFILPGDSLWGIAVSYGLRNNYAQLDKVQVSETVETDSKGNSILKSTNARLGEYNESNAVSINFDIIWYQRWTRNRIAIGILGRYDGYKDQFPFTPGIGIFVAKKGSPLLIVGGLTFELKDDKLGIGLHVGFPFK
jgi:hypothetical protein